AGVLAAPLGGCGGEPGLAASFEYEMPARFEVPALRAPEEQSEYEVYVDGPVQPDTWRVRFDACRSAGSPVKYSWSIDGEQVSVETRCDGFAYEFPAEGEYSVSLAVEDSSGEEREQTEVIVVRDLLIFGLGDSYASGEGSPDVNEFDEGGAQWQNLRCHRSAQSGQVRAAQMIEDADPHTSVTFVHVACSGGRIHRALLEPYLGIVENGELLPPQIFQVDELARDHEIDALFVSIGGNDINFSKVVEACVLGEVCHLGNPMIDPLLESTSDLVCGLLGSFEDECKSYLDPEVIDVDSLDARTIFEIGSKDEYVDGVDVHQDGLDDLPANYDDLGQAIVGSLGMDPARVYLTEIPDVTRDEFGDLCAWPTELPGFTESLRIAAQQVPGVTKTEMEWASNYVLTELRAAMRAAASKNGWQFVEGVDARFAGHGYCSDVEWLTRLQNTFQFQGDQNGALHPNVAGYGAYADAIVEAFDSAQ
ncbi:GDSL-type esterase/lipase family protein, partial [Deltaproteobacteria bacterium]|nr:GDSL-type esterase/lipase family protein [Deltaproteobacteria bacterium]